MQDKYIHIKKIDLDTAKKAITDFCDNNPIDAWEVNGTLSVDNAICYCTLDENCYYIYDLDTSYFVYFALNRGNIEHIKGLWETVYELVCEGEPYVVVYGKKGRYEKILKTFGHFFRKENDFNDEQEMDTFVWYIAHPDVIKKLERRFR